LPVQSRSENALRALPLKVFLFSWQREVLLQPD
jgi:hypothetical protein